MGVIRKFLGPKSKYDKSLPYTYLAKETIIEGEDDLCSYHYADTLCALVEYLEEMGIMPDEVELFGIYKKEEIQLNKDRVTAENGDWLLRPELCRALEEYFQKTKDVLYKGHMELDECSFEDRDREVDAGR